MNTTAIQIEDYCLTKSTLPSKDCQAIEDYTRVNVHAPHMLIGKLEASFIGFLLRSIDAKNVLELGTYTGYSALAMAENLPEDGLVTTVDINTETVELAQKFWNQSVHGHKIRSIIGKGLDVLAQFEVGLQFDFIFIDADKRNYIEYLKCAVEMLSPHGMIVVDNVLWGGKVLPSSELDLSEHRDRNTEFIRAMNDYISQSENLYGTLMPIRDGMFLVKRMEVKK
jgi:caffeoyl-CoA O-methyltransferase